MVPLHEKLALLKVFREVFANAAKERKNRQEYAADPCEGKFTHMVPGYVLFERETLHKAVNAERGRRGLAPVGIGAIDLCERLACGHVDYADKYPLYCVEIALGENNGPLP